VNLFDKYSKILHNARHIHQDYLHGAQLKTKRRRKTTNGLKFPHLTIYYYLGVQYFVYYVLFYMLL